MRILFIAPYVPSLVRARPYNLIRFLHAAGHELTLVCLGSDEDHHAIDGLRQYLCAIYVFNLPRWHSLLNCALAVPTTRPLQAVYCWQPSMARLVNDLAGKANGRSSYDVVHVEHMRAVRYALEVKKLPQAPPVVWDSVDSITHLFRQASRKHPRKLARLGLQLELQRTEAYERKLADHFDQVLVTSQIDRQVFLDLQPTGRIQVLPNGVDLDYFHPDPLVQRDPDTIVISGKMSYHANISMALKLAKDILPLVWAKRPHTRLVICGQNPSPEVEKLAEDPRIRVTGTVDDLRPYLQGAAVAAAPLDYGAGIQNKVLEAMACGTPVVASSLAVSALRAQLGQEILVADQPADFAEHLINVLNNPAWAAKLGVAGREYVQREHSWHAVANQLGQIYHGLVSR